MSHLLGSTMQEKLASYDVTLICVFSFENKHDTQFRLK